MTIGVLCPSEIAFRRFMPALKFVSDFSFIGVAVNTSYERFGDLHDYAIVNSAIENTLTKAKKFIDFYGGKIFHSYEDLVKSDDVEAVYIPLPPGLHYKWAKMALEYGKHVLVEKPTTICFDDTKELVNIAKTKNLAFHENYMFAFHSQINEVQHIIDSGIIGNIRLYRISFGFPLRQLNDFRYNKNLGGGALFDAGGYTIKYANILLGNYSKVISANLNYINGFEVDMYGAGTLINKNGDTAQISFGMDNEYKCELEVWGSKGTIRADRAITAPAGYEPTYTIIKNGEVEHSKFKPDDSFKNSILHFIKCINDANVRNKNYEEILKQSELISDFLRIANNSNNAKY